MCKYCVKENQKPWLTKKDEEMEERQMEVYKHSNETLTIQKVNEKSVQRDANTARLLQ